MKIFNFLKIEGWWNPQCLNRTKKAYAQSQRLRRISQWKWQFPIWAPRLKSEDWISRKTTLFGLVVTLKSEMFILIAKFDASVDVERMLFLVQFKHWDPTNPRFSRGWRISYICEKRTETTTKQLVAICSVVRKWTWRFLGFITTYKSRIWAL